MRKLTQKCEFMAWFWLVSHPDIQMFES